VFIFSAQAAIRSFEGQLARQRADTPAGREVLCHSSAMLANHACVVLE